MSESVRERQGGRETGREREDEGLVELELALDGSHLCVCVCVRERE